MKIIKTEEVISLPPLNRCKNKALDAPYCRVPRSSKNETSKSEKEFDMLLISTLSRKRVMHIFKYHDQFLLKKCLSYDWRGVELCCEALVHFFTKGNHDDKETLEATKRQLLAKDHWGNSALHAACYYKPPHSVVSELLRAAKYFPGGPLQLHMEVNAKGSTPLMIACTSGACRQTIQTLLQPDGLVHAGATVSIMDRQANTAFLGLARRYEMMRKIPKNAQKTLPLHEVSEVPVDAEKNEEPIAGDEEEEMIMRAAESDPHNHSRMFGVFWNKVDMLIQAAWFADLHGDATPENEMEMKTLPLRESFLSIVHGAAYVAEMFPPLLTSLVLRCHPGMASEACSKGVLPLHLAVMADHTRAPCVSNFSVINQRQFFIEKLLEVDPSGASCPIPSTKRLPLTEAIDSGLQWDVPSEDGEAVAGPLQSLWHCAPDALSQQDPVTGLRPFQLAAAVQFEPATDSAVSTKDDDTTETEIFHVNTIYALLRSDPSQLSL